jgi:hypothetical protein
MHEEGVPVKGTAMVGLLVAQVVGCKAKALERGKST